MKNALFLTIVVLISGFGCNSKSNESISDALVEANQVHQDALDLREEIMDFEKQLKENEVDYAGVKENLKIWDKDIIEVPGFEHSHDDEHQRRYHVHNAMKPMSDNEHLEYQKMMFAEIQQIHEQLQRLLAQEVMEGVEGQNNEN
jgi:polyribonucleotide nucleotidyltransferase